MWARAAAGGAAIGVYAWRVHDPKGSYAVFFDISNWFTSWFISGDWVSGIARNMINLILIDQADGFFLGVAFFAFVSIVLWPIRAGCLWCGKKILRLFDPRQHGMASGT